MATSAPGPIRKSQRQPLSCTECTRRKLRCSKTIPCTSCVDRGNAEFCRREFVQVPRSRRKGGANRRMPEQRPLKPNRSAANVPWHDAVGSSSGPPGTAHGNERTPDKRPLVVLPQLSSEATVMLEFLPMGRQSILNRAGRTSVDHDTRGGDCASLKVPGLWDLAVPLETARRLLAFHEENLAWMHNAVHMPTFGREFESALIAGSPCDKQWQALYYAILCSTVHHADEEDLLALDSSISPSAVQDLYNKCLTTLFNSNFMAIHSISSIQAICILLQVAHNLNQSDFIMVLMSATIRIAQSLNLHRLGSERADHRDVREDPARTVQDLIDLEVKKRVWWFIVRQDWLQVPFQNTYLIHATQFNTPVPLNCYEDPATWGEGGYIAVQPGEVFTQSSYTAVMNEVSGIMWKHQDRMHSIGHPGRCPDGISKLYAEVLRSDEELKRGWTEMPQFLHIGYEHPPGTPSYVPLIAHVHLLCIAHKILTIHRHFRLRSFQDKQFAYTQMSCISIAQKCIRDAESWPKSACSRRCLRMWTVIAHLTSCCIFVILAAMYSRNNVLLYEGSEMRKLAATGREIIRSVESHSSIARKGVKLIDVLLDIAASTEDCDELEFSVEDVIRQVCDREGYSDSMESTDFLLTEQSLWDEFGGEFNLA